MAGYSEKQSIKTEMDDLRRRMRILETMPTADQINPPPPPPVEPAEVYTYSQLSSSAVWDIVHNLGFVPSVSVYDTLNREVYADINVIDANHIQVLFTQPFSGIAYLS